MATVSDLQRGLKWVNFAKKSKNNPDAGISLKDGFYHLAETARQPALGGSECRPNWR